MSPQQVLARLATAAILQSVDSILKKMWLVMKGERPPKDCHGMVADAIQKRRNPNDRILFFGEGDYVSHSILLDDKNRVLVDTMKGHYDPKTAVYTDKGGHEHSLLSSQPVTRLML